MYGYHGRYLRVDLSSARADFVPLPGDVLRRFVGGVGLATYLLHREAPPRVEPLSPAAPLVFALSPLVGTPLTTSAKFRRRRQVAAHRPPQRRPVVVALRPRRQARRPRRPGRRRLLRRSLRPDR
jgi:hypothetical protein